MEAKQATKVQLEDAAAGLPSNAFPRFAGKTQGNDEDQSGRSLSRPRKGLTVSKAIRDLVDEDYEASEDENERPSHPDVMSKYKLAGKIVDDTLDMICKKCSAGASTKDLCAMGDKELYNRCRGVFRTAKNPETGEPMKRGICFPTTISVNHILCHHTPFHDGEATILQPNDVVKVHMGAHVDGFPVTAARTIFVPDTGDVATGTEGSPPSPAAANAWLAAYYAMKQLVEHLRPGAVNHDLTTLIESTVARFPGIILVEGVLSNRTKRWIIDGSDCIISTRILDQEPFQDVDFTEVKEGQVWTLDVAVTTASSRRLQTTETNETNIFRRNQFTGLLRLSSGERTLHEIRSFYQCFPFQARQSPEPLKTRLGLSALRKADMVDAFPVLQCKKGYVTVRFSCTVAVQKNRTTFVAGTLPAISPHVLSAASVVVPAEFAAPVDNVLSDERASKKRRKDATNVSTD